MLSLICRSIYVFSSIISFLKSEFRFTLSWSRVFDELAIHFQIRVTSIHHMCFILSLYYADFLHRNACNWVFKNTRMTYILDYIKFRSLNN